MSRRKPKKKVIAPPIPPATCRCGHGKDDHAWEWQVCWALIDPAHDVFCACQDVGRFALCGGTRGTAMSDDKPLFFGAFRWPAEMDPDAMLRREIASSSANATKCPVCGQRIWTTRDKDLVMATCSADGDFFWTVVNGRLVQDPRPKQTPKSYGRPIGST